MHTESLSTLTNKELLTQTLQSATQEKQATYSLLLHLSEIQKRRLYAEIGYSSLWEYTVKELGYSEAAASERCNAMRLCFSLPEAHSKIKNGELNFTAASKIQRFIYTEKKRTGKEMKTEAKQDLIKAVTGKSTREIEKVFLELNPIQAPKEKMKSVGSGEKTALQFSIDQETLDLLNRLKELRGDISLSEAFKLTLKHYISKNDPLLKKERKNTPASDRQKQTQNQSHLKTKVAVKNLDTAVQNTAPALAPEPKKLIKSTNLHNSPKYRKYKNINVKSKLCKKSDAQCTYISSSGRRCSSRTKLQIDHIKPLAKKGDSSLENLRLLCPEHNRLAAIKEYGTKKMSTYLKNLH